MTRSGGGGRQQVERRAARAVPAAASGLCLALALAVAGRAPAAAAPPDGAAILDRYVEVTGGKAAYDSVQNRVVHATLEIPAQSIKLDVTHYQARPNQSYSVVESQVLGKIESGVSGGFAWESSTMAGPRLKDGAEEQEAMREAAFDMMASWRRYFPKAELAGEDTVGGRRCWKVVMTPRFGRPRTNWFDQETGLVQKSEFVAESAAGAVAATVYPGDYRKVGGILMPFRAETTVLGQKRILTIHSVEQNVELPAKRFAPPADVQKLIDAKAKK
jgi:zinc protease